MRISDWSSDVCSSDLGHRVQCVEDAHAARVEVLRGALAARALAQVVGRAVLARQEPRGEAVVGHHADVFGDAQVAQRAFEAGAVAEVVFRLQHRSEEHTSELQSLMRISYAVFCLKKKKTTTTQHIQK